LRRLREERERLTLAHSIKPCHAAALALLGWYLMVPPSLADGSWICGDGFTGVAARRVFGTEQIKKTCAIRANTANVNAPLAEWHEIRPFETLDACQEAKNKLYDAARAGSPVDGAECVATDDPRLR
jgi:hypothetical protein